MIIYKITNKINGKIYIGQTIQSLKSRWFDHCKPSSGCICLRNAIQKYGKENFTVEQIDIACDRNELDLKEQYWIKYYDSMNRDKGYNLLSGGNHSVFSEETRKKISNSLKHSFIFQKFVRSNERRKKLSESHKGKKYSKEFGEKISKSNKGRKFSEEHKQKLRLAQLGKYDGSKNPRAKKVICVETGEIFDCILDASNKTNTNKTSISYVCKGKRNIAGGYHWRYVDE